MDGIKVRNRFIVAALRSLLETDGQAVDYGDLGVRHLGSIYESILEFEVRQADRDIMLLEDKDGVREVEAKEESTYSYKKNDLYLVSGAGIAMRKASASFYTPDEIVSFLVGRGLEPILEGRRKKVAVDVRRYKKDPSDHNSRICIDRILDLQVLDPAMGSGHFLVEALNQITRWATGVLSSHPDHPLVSEIDKDRRDVVKAQEKRGVTIDQSLLTADVLLKRRIMKRCIFGVDLNGLAAELARLSLWLDSFAIGMPLTYLGHNSPYSSEERNSTIGSWLADIAEILKMRAWTSQRGAGRLSCLASTNQQVDHRIWEIHAGMDEGCRSRRSRPPTLRSSRPTPAGRDMKITESRLQSIASHLM